MPLCRFSVGWLHVPGWTYSPGHSSNCNRTFLQSNRTDKCIWTDHISISIPHSPCIRMTGGRHCCTVNSRYKVKYNKSSKATRRKNREDTREYYVPIPSIGRVRGGIKVLCSDKRQRRGTDQQTNKMTFHFMIFSIPASSTLYYQNGTVII